MHTYYKNLKINRNSVKRLFPFKKIDVHFLLFLIAGSVEVAVSNHLSNLDCLRSLQVFKHCKVNDTLDARHHSLRLHGAPLEMLSTFQIHFTSHSTKETSANKAYRLDGCHLPRDASVPLSDWLQSQQAYVHEEDELYPYSGHTENSLPTDLDEISTAEP